MQKTLSPEVKRFAHALLRDIGTPFAKSVEKLIDQEDWVGIANTRVSPKAFEDPSTYFLDAQASALLRKLEDLPTPPDSRRREAIANWKKGEQACYRTNERLAPYLEGVTHPDYDPAIAHHLMGIRKIVKSILGRAPSLDALQGKFGPGGTFSDPAVRSTIADKMNVCPTITRPAKWFLLNWFGTAWYRAQAVSVPRRGPILVKGNKFSVAPKDALKDRPIGSEPAFNIFYQLALGQEIRHRLRIGAGIDLEKAQDIHKRVACEASITGRHATLDLSNASDTVAYNLVRLLLPPDWFELLNSLRSPFTLFRHPDLRCLAGDRAVQNKGKGWVQLEKFSSMGNGFTFELETLIFYAITKYVEMMFLDCAVEPLTLVYGDDIICNTEIVKPVISILNYCGFDLNREKSFWEGPFRESCGGDYFAGEAVRPYFMKESPCEPQHYIAAANGVRRAFEEAPVGFAPARRAWFNLLDNVPVDIRRCRGPQSLGDIVIHDSEDRWVTRWRSQSKYIRVYRPHKHRKVPWKLFDDAVVLACAVYGLPWGGGGLIPRNPMSSYKVGWTVAYGTKFVPEVLRISRLKRNTGLNSTV